MTTSAVYLRISKDKGLGTEDEGLAVDRQRKDIHKLLKAKGWEIGKEYLDNDVSASGKVPRPEYERMLADFEAGEIDAITAWKLDRLWRVPKELEHIIDLVEKTSLTVATVDSDIDLNTSQGRVMARVLTAFAQDELDKRSARQKAKFAQDREAGKDHWRGRRPFGLTLEGKEVPDEAAGSQGRCRAASRRRNGLSRCGATELSWHPDHLRQGVAASAPPEDPAQPPRCRSAGT